MDLLLVDPPRVYWDLGVSWVSSHLQSDSFANKMMEYLCLIMEYREE